MQDVVIGCRCHSIKEAETRAISAALRKAKDFGFLRTHIFSDAMEVINAIKGAEDWVIENLVEDIWMSRVFLRRLNFPLFLGNLMGLPLNLVLRIWNFLSG